MGTYVSISIGEFDFLTSKNSFGELLLPFSSRDLRIEDAFDEDGEQYTRRYFSSTVSRLKLILDSDGFTIEVAKQNFATLKTEKLDFIQYCLESDGETFGLSQEGEVMQKGLIQSKFFNKCKTPENGNQILEYDDNWTEMRLLLNCLFNAFAPSN